MPHPLTICSPILFVCLLAFSSHARAECAASVVDRICWVDSSDLEASKANPEYKRNCLRGGKERFAQRVVAICNQLPPLFQSIMTNVDVIHIERDLNTVAYAAATGRRSIVGIQQEVLENEVPFEQLFSWKEQLIFRKKTARFESDSKLPQYRLTGPALLNSALLYVLIHELGHILDYRNGVNAPWADAEWDGTRYKATAGTKSMKSYLGSISFYGSTSAIYPTFAENLYASLQESTFISAYASTNSFEDFAEMLAHYVFLIHYGQNIQLVLEGRILLDARKRLESEAFGPKFDFIERFLMRTDLKLRP